MLSFDFWQLRILVARRGAFASALSEYIGFTLLFALVLPCLVFRFCMELCRKVKLSAVIHGKNNRRAFLFF